MYINFSHLLNDFNSYLKPLAKITIMFALNL